MFDEQDDLPGHYPPTEVDLDVRSAQRRVCVHVTPLRLLSKPAFNCILGFVRDISLKGIGLRCTAALAPGSQVAIDWNIGSPSAHRTLLAHVVHVFESSEHVWLIGCEFDTPLTEEELNALFSKPAP